MKPYYITNTIAIDPAFALCLASLVYKPGSNRPDDCGSLYVAPVCAAIWDAPAGVLALYASTNGDPILIGQIEDREITWIDENNSDTFPEHMRTALESACWLDDKQPNEHAAELCELVRSAIPPAE